MKNVFRIISKNLKLLIRSKSSALIIILAPLLLILLVGIAFDNANAYGLNIGVFSQSDNENVDLLIDKQAALIATLCPSLLSGRCLHLSKKVVH